MTNQCNKYVNSFPKTGVKPVPFHTLRSLSRLRAPRLGFIYLETYKGYSPTYTSIVTVTSKVDFFPVFWLFMLHSGNKVTALETIKLHCILYILTLSPSATSHIFSSVTGLMVENVFPLAEST